MLRSTTDRRGGTVFRIDPEWITMIPASETHPAHECDKCHQIAWRNVNGACPTWCCDGNLQPAPSTGRPTSEHYRSLYTTLSPSGMRAEEHTGQLETNRALQFQQAFLDSELNALSCTTTFELGVDLGDVKAVLMRNVPPVAGELHSACRPSRTTRLHGSASSSRSLAAVATTSTTSASRCG